MKKSISIVLISMLLLPGCAWLRNQTKTGYQPNSFERNIPLITTVLRGAGSAASIAATMEQKSDGAFTICMVATSAKTILSSAADVLEKRGAVFPEVRIDFSGCLAENGGPGKNLDAVDVDSKVLDISGELLNSALGLVKHYAQDLKGKDCIAHSLAIASTDYVRSMIDPVIDEMKNPNGEVVVPEQIVDLSRCAAEAAANVEKAVEKPVTPPKEEPEPQPEPEKESE